MYSLEQRLYAVDVLMKFKQISLIAMDYKFPNELVPLLKGKSLVRYTYTNQVKSAYSR